MTMQEHPVPATTGKRIKEAIRILDDVRGAIEQNPESARVAALAEQLVTLLASPVSTDPEGVRGGLAPWQKRKVDRYMKEHLDLPVRLDALAEQLALSVSHFSRAFKETFGDTPHAHIVRLRLELAQEMMLETKATLSQVAIACGLADQAHLAKVFRRVVNETPSGWRRRNLNESHAGTQSRCLETNGAPPASRSGRKLA
jgi:AraC-like DNA-binding protein